MDPETSFTGVSGEGAAGPGTEPETAVTIRPFIPMLFDGRLPIPSPHLYWDNYVHPNSPNTTLYPADHGDGAWPPFQYRFPAPWGCMPAQNFHVLGAPVHDFGDINAHPTRYFVKYMLWYLELDDRLVSLVCPSDLNDTPCEWDELQGGCPMLRLCEIKQKYPHPHLGVIPQCDPEFRLHCRYLHGIEPTCRHMARQLRLPEHERFCSAQLCEAVAEGGFCVFGHDFESARSEAVRRYWDHRRQARARGSIGFVKQDVWGRNVLTPIRPIEEAE